MKGVLSSGRGQSLHRTATEASAGPYVGKLLIKDTTAIISRDCQIDVVSVSATFLVGGNEAKSLPSILHRKEL